MVTTQNIRKGTVERPHRHEKKMPTPCWEHSMVVLVISAGTLQCFRYSGALLILLDQREESEVKARTRTGSCLMVITGTSRCAPDMD